MSRKNRDVLVSFDFLILLASSILFYLYIRGFALKNVLLYLPLEDRDNFRQVCTKVRDCAVSAQTEAWEEFVDLALKRNNISERIPIVTFEDNRKLNNIYEQLKDCVFVSSMDFETYVYMYRKLDEIYDLYDECAEDLFSAEPKNLKDFIANEQEFNIPSDLKKLSDIYDRTYEAYLHHDDWRELCGDLYYTEKLYESLTGHAYEKESRECYHENVVLHYAKEYADKNGIVLTAFLCNKILKACLFSTNDVTYYFVCPRGEIEPINNEHKLLFNIIRYIHKQLSIHKQINIRPCYAECRNDGFLSGKNSILSFFDIHFDGTSKDFFNDIRFGCKKDTKYSTKLDVKDTYIFLKNLLLSYRNVAFLGADRPDQNNYYYSSTEYNGRIWYLEHDSKSEKFYVGWRKDLIHKLFSVLNNGKEDRWEYYGPESANQLATDFVKRLCDMHEDEDVVITEEQKEALIIMLTQIIIDLKK